MNYCPRISSRLDPPSTPPVLQSAPPWYVLHHVGWCDNSDSQLEIRVWE
jgi:hypothetical protein